MTVILHGRSVSEEQTNSTVWQTKFEVSKDITIIDPTEYYKVIATCEITGTLTTYGVACQVLVDGIERGFDGFIPFVSNKYKVSTFFIPFELEPPSSGVHTVAIRYASDNALQTAKIRRVRIVVEKH